MKRMSMLTTAAAAFIWTASLATPAEAQSGAGTSGSAGSQAGSSEGVGTRGAGAQDETTADPRTEQDAERTRQDAQGDRNQRDMQRFIEQAAVANMAEIQLGQLGADRAQSPEVKEFAQMMVEEHTKALEQLRSVATAQGFEVPTELDSKHRRIHQKLSEAEADRFDREFMNAMVDTHKSTEKLLRKRAGKDGRGQVSADAGRAAGAPATSGEAGESAAGAAGTQARSGDDGAGAASGTPGAVGTSGATPSSADQWASMTLPKVRSHLEQARALEQQVKQESRRSNANESDTGATGSQPQAPGSQPQAPGSQPQTPGSQPQGPDRQPQ